MSIILLSAGTFLLAANQVRDLKWLRRITWAYVAIGALTLLVRSLLPELGISTRAWLQSVGTVFYIWLVAIAFSQAVFNGELHRGWRLLLGGLVLMTLFVLLVSKFGDKSGWLSVLICIAAITGARSWRAGLALLAVAGGAALLAISGLVASDAYSISTRSDAWSIILQLAKLSPLWGLGFANYYWYTPLFPIRGYAVSFNSHNNYVDIIAQMGLLGLIGFLWLFWELGRLGWQLRERVPAGFARAYVYGALGGLAGMLAAGMFGDWVLPFFYNVGLTGFRTSMIGWLFLGGLVSLEQLVRNQKQMGAQK
jgi:O-antigen ligase